MGLHVRAQPFKDREEPYSDYRHLDLRGRLLHPKTIKAEEAEVTLLPNRRLNEGERARDTPRSVRSFQLHRGRLEVILSMPLDALPCVLQMAIADRFRYVVLSGDRPRYRQGRIRNYRLQMTIDEDDLLSGDSTVETPPHDERQTIPAAP